MSTWNTNVPLLLKPTRVRRTYLGGAWLDQRLGLPEPKDSNRPEEWLSSMTEAKNPGFPPISNEGLSTALIDGKEVLLRDIVASDPVGMLGKAHVDRFGAQAGVLTKIIDSAERLSIQVHPDKTFAKQYFHSDYGKTECWHILGTRPVNGQKPFLMIGFRPGVTREKWEKLYHQQDIPGMLDCLHKVTPLPGETWLIRGGLPHAIGPGCILIEIQEPTDYTLRSERTMADGTLIPDALIHQGLGEEGLMNCFHYDPLTMDELIDSCRIAPQIKMYPDGSRWELLIGPKDTECFCLEKTDLIKKLQYKSEGTFSSLTVLQGEGILSWEGGQMPLRNGQQLFLPAGLRSFTLENASNDPFTLIRAHPPAVTPAPPVNL